MFPKCDPLNSHILLNPLKKDFLQSKKSNAVAKKPAGQKKMGYGRYPFAVLSDMLYKKCISLLGHGRSVEQKNVQSSFTDKNGRTVKLKNRMH